MSNARHTIFNLYNHADDLVTHAMDLEVRDCQCNRQCMTVLLSDEDLKDDDILYPWKLSFAGLSVRAFSDPYPFTRY